MPITQDRMIALIAAAEYYHNLLAKLQQSVLETIRQETIPYKDRLTMVYRQMVEVRHPDIIRETILTEKAHFAANHKKNDRKRGYLERSRMLKAKDFTPQATELLHKGYVAEPAHQFPIPPSLANTEDQPDDLQSLIASDNVFIRQMEGKSPEQQAEMKAAILAEGKAHAAEIRGQEAMGELAHHPNQILNRGSNFGLAAPPPPIIHNSTDNNEARKKTPQEIQEMAERNNAAGYGSEPI